MNHLFAFSLRGFGSASALAIALASPPAIAQEQTFQFDMPAQSTEQAVREFAKITRSQVAFDGAELQGRQSSALNGEYSPRVALEHLLEGTGLGFTIGNTRVFVIRPLALAAVTAADASYPNDGAEIVISGYRTSFATALNEKRNADQVIDMISAEEVGQFPDQNVAEAIQRVSGVSITRNDGEGESVTIRGLSPTFTRIEIDGRSTTVTTNSADPSRASVLSTFASDLYSSIEVVKSPTAADVEGGIGGTVRLKTPDPLDIGKLRYGVQAGGTIAEMREKVEPSVLGFYSDSFADNRLGVLVTGSYEKQDRRLDKIQNTVGWSTVTAKGLADSSDPGQAALVGTQFAGESRQEQRIGTRERINLNAKLQAQPTDSLNLYANGLYTRDEQDEDRSRIQIDWTRGTVTGGMADADGTLSQAGFKGQRTDIRQFTRLSTLETWGATGGFNWTPEGWNIDGEIAYSKSKDAFSEYRVDARINKDGAGSYDLDGDAHYPSVEVASAATPLDKLDVRGLQLQQRIISLAETKYKLDAERELALGPITGFQAGIRYSQDRFERLQGAIANSGSGLTFADAPVQNFVLDGSFGQGFGSNLLSQWPSVDPVSFYNAHPAEEAFSFNDENLYFIDENVLAGYGMAKFDTPLFGGLSARGNFGARVVNTSYEGQGRVNVTTSAGEFLLDDTPALDSERTDVLPSFNVVFGDADYSRLLLRGAVTRAMSRPVIQQINPGFVVSVPDGDIDRGNPDLEPFRAWQYDLGLEFYFGARREGLLSVAAFAKDVQDFIVNDRYIANYAFPAAGVEEQPFVVNSYKNGGKADIKGVEVNFQTPLSFLPEPFNGLGFYANYTFTDSNFTDEFGNSFSFPGASRNTFNIVGYYESGGFSTRLAYNYRDDYLITPSSQEDGQNAIYGEAQGRLDYALRYRFENGLRFSLDVLNLTNEQQYEYYDAPNRLSSLDFEGRIYSLSVGYVF